MASIIEGYNYDIFISYRQKDNKGDRWVSEFVDSLKTELESTFKEEISVYFDINPHDGLLETHDVDESLKEKLRCLVFIPIISRTYCDPKSFAWEHEFKAFVEQATKDKYGLKIKLPNGNVASRVLPVKIHDIEKSDLFQCESQLGGPLRSVEFVFRSAGVDRPLRVREENHSENLNKTNYRDQINKVANSIRWIFKGLKNEPDESEVVKTSRSEIVSHKEKSIIVLPFENMSPDPDQEYFSDGLTEELITELSHIKDLLVISRSSAMTFKGSKKKISDIATDVKVQYVLEGSVRKAGTNIRITAQLIDAVTDTHLWAQKYDGNLEDIFQIQERVSGMIAKSLMANISTGNEVTKRTKHIDDVISYECLLKARHEIYMGTEESIRRALTLLSEIRERVGEKTEILAAESEAYFFLPIVTGSGVEESNSKIRQNADKIFSLDPSSAYGYLYKGLAQYKTEWGAVQGYFYTRKAFEINSNEPFILMSMMAYCAHFGYPEKAIHYLDKLDRIDPVSFVNKLSKGYFLMFLGERDKAGHLAKEICSAFPENGYFLGFSALILSNIEEEDTFWTVFNQLELLPEDNWSRLGLLHGYARKSDLAGAERILTENFKKTAAHDETFSWTLSQCYARLGFVDDSVMWLENAMKRGFFNYPFITQRDPFLKDAIKEKRFERVLSRMKTEWETNEPKEYIITK
jgi:TolB-like protein